MSAIIPVHLNHARALSASQLAALHMADQVETMVERYGMHVDSDGNNAVDRHRLDTLNNCLGESARRTDAFGDSNGWHQPRELEYQYQEILREETPDENAMRLFFVDPSVPLGARRHTVTRTHTQGSAVWYRGGVEVPMASASKDQETFPVNYIVAGYEESTFDRMSNAFAGDSPIALKQSGAIDAIDRKMNETAWFGDASVKMYGIFNYPYLAVSNSAVNYTSGSPDDILADLHAGKNWASENSKQVFGHTGVVTSERVRNKLMQRPRTTNSDMTVGQMWLRDNGSISSFEVAWECEAAGPAGEDAMLFHRRGDRNSIAIVVPQGPTITPTQQQGFMHRTLIWAAYGGVIMRNAGNVHLRWINV